MPITIGGITYLTMQDDISAGNLTVKSPITGVEYDAYGGYQNGAWPDVGPIRARFPGKPVVGWSVWLANTGDGLDIEPGDATPNQAPAYYNERRAAGDTDRLVMYSGASDMNTVIDDLTAVSIPFAQVRLHTAHYGWRDVGNRTNLANRHICGPRTCGLVKRDVDATQWCDTDTYDESLLRANYFGGIVPPGTTAPTSQPVAPAVVVAAVPAVPNATGTPINYPGDELLAIPGNVTLDADGNGYLDVPLPTGKSFKDFVKATIDWSSPRSSTPAGKYTDEVTTSCDFASPAGAVTVVFRNGRPGGFYTFRAWVAA